MQVTMNLNPAEFGDLIEAVDKNITVTATPLEYQELAGKLVGKAVGNPAKLSGNELTIVGDITEIQTDGFPMLVTIKTKAETEITFAVDEPLRIELENNATVGLMLSVVLVLKPKYRAGEFYYELRLKSYEFV